MNRQILGGTKSRTLGQSFSNAYHSNFCFLGFVFGLVRTTPGGRNFAQGGGGGRKWVLYILPWVAPASWFLERKFLGSFDMSIRWPQWLGLPCGWQGPKNLGCPLLPPRVHVSRELGWNPTAFPCGMPSCREQLEPTGPEVEDF